MKLLIKRNLKIYSKRQMKITFTVFLMMFASFTAFSQDVIKKLDNPNGWLITTKSSAYQLTISSGKRITPVFYGSKEQAEFKAQTNNWVTRVEEIPVRGAYGKKLPVLEVIYPDHVRDADLELVEAEEIEIDGRPTLKIVQRDRKYPLQVISYIRVLYEFNILEKWIEVKNTGKADIKIDNLLSGSIVMPQDEYEFTQLSGNEMGEFQEFKSLLTPGSKLLENRLFKSQLNMPWFLIRPQDSAKDPTGPAWWGNVHYSGNWKIQCEKGYDRSSGNTLQVVAGINFWDTELDLKSGKTFTTPKFSVGYTNEGAEGASVDNAAYIRETILPVSHRKELRPILFNSWYATTYFLEEKQQIDMAKVAAKLGVELFAIDDGWFKNRIAGDKGLGDWEVDKLKFPNGLTPLIDSVHNLGMKFGIWVEPESAVINSEVWKNHPNWILQYPGRRQLPGRMFLNLAREDVYNYLFTSLDKLLSENKIDFVKWDQNTDLSDAGWMDAPVEMQKEVRIRFIDNVYRLVDALRKRHPKVFFESCASGGGRVDLGMLSKMDMAWTSDNSTAIDRIFIQYGYLAARPANTMVSWVLDGFSLPQQGNPYLGYKFDVAMSGVLGIGADIRKFTVAEQNLAKEKIELYKQIRPLVQFGVCHRLLSPFEHSRSALQFNDATGKSSAVFFYNLATYVNRGYVRTAPYKSGQVNDRGSSVIKLQGLISDKKYLVKNTSDKADKGTIYPGDYLMNIGLSWPITASFASTIFTIDMQ
jgi:alpha-galactosidase